MKNLKIILIVLLPLWFIHFESYGQQNEAAKPFEGKVEQAPLNPVLKQVRYTGNSEGKDQDLTQKTFNFSVFNSERQAVVGKSEFNGSLNIVEKGRMRFLTNEEQSLLISYKVPDKLEFDRALKLDDAVLKIREFSNPGGARTEVLVTNKEDLLFSFIWKTDTKPLALVTENNLKIKQEAISNVSIEAGYIPLQVQIETDKDAIVLKAGETKSFTHKGKKYICFVEQSTYLVANNNGGCEGEGYILKAIIRLQ